MTVLLDPDARPVIGHRGNRAHSPEDTIESMREAVALGVDGLEFDVHITRDGVPVVHHDATLDRTTNTTGPLAERTLAELADVDAGYHWTPDNGRSFPWRGRGVRIPTLADALAAFPTVPCIIEIKVASATEAARRVVMKHAAERRVIMAGFEGDAMRPLAGGPIALGASTPDLIRLLPRALLGLTPPEQPFVAACIPPTHHGVPLPIRAIARAMRRRGGVTHVWTVNSPDHAQQLWEDGVQGIITDDPALILAARDGRTLPPAASFGPE